MAGQAGRFTDCGAMRGGVLFFCFLDAGVVVMCAACDCGAVVGRQPVVCTPFPNVGLRGFGLVPCCRITYDIARAGVACN